DTKLSAYYAVDSLISAQVELLASRQMVPFKVAMVNQRQEMDTLGFDSVTWGAELQAFRVLDLNKSNLLNAYDIQTSATGFTYRLKQSEAQQGVLDLSIDQLSNGDPVLITGTYAETNNLYSSQRDYELRLDGKGVLQYYKVDGKQKVAFGEWVNYNVEGHVGRRP
ncbi:MAG: hypothetical protein AAGC88_07010, partial [Bacteroidota bacterium]